MFSSLSQIHPKLHTNGVGIGNTHRRISLGFLKPDKKNPLLYRRAEERSFRSLDEDFGSEFFHESDEEAIDGGELSRRNSAPSMISSAANTIDQHSYQDVDWLLEEHQRRYSTAPSLEDPDEETALIPPEEETTYTTFMNRVRNNLERRASYNSYVYEEAGEDFINEKVTRESEIKVLISYSIPLVMTFILEDIFGIVSSLMVGHLGTDELAAVSLASMTSNITLAVFSGIATALDTLCPQAYGSGNYYGVGVHFQRCLLFSLVVYIPFALLWLNSEPLLFMMVGEENLAYLTAKFLKISTLGVPAYIGFETLKRFVQAQGIFNAGIYVLFICAPLNVLISYILVWKVGLGYIGAPIAVVINFWLMFLLLIGYIIFVDGSKCWGGWSKKCLTHWGDLAKLAIPGIVMLEAEDLSYEILTLVAARFGTSYLAAQSAVSSIATLTYMVPFAVGIATSTRVANFVGAKRLDCAKLSSEIGIFASVIVGSLGGLTLYFLRGPIAHMFSREEKVINLIIDIFPLVALIQVFDALNAIAGSCLRGQGRQIIGGVVNLCVYYLFAIPLGIVLGLVMDWRLVGLWIGIGTGMLLIGLIESYFVLTADWEMILQMAKLRAEEEDDEEDDISV